MDQAAGLTERFTRHTHLDTRASGHEDGTANEQPSGPWAERQHVTTIWTTVPSGNPQVSMRQHTQVDGLLPSSCCLTSTRR